MINGYRNRKDTKLGMYLSISQDDISNESNLHCRTKNFANFHFPTLIVQFCFLFLPSSLVVFAP